MSKKEFRITQFIVLIILIFAILFLVVWYLEAKPHRFNPNDFNLSDSEASYVRRMSPQRIPHEVYEASVQNNSWRNILHADRKVAFLVTPENKPYLPQFKYELVQVLKDIGMRRIYSREIKRLIPPAHQDCMNKPCAHVYLMQTCGEDFCIINPSRREIVVDRSHNPRIAAALLHKYKNW